MATGWQVATGWCRAWSYSRTGRFIRRRMARSRRRTSCWSARRIASSWFAPGMEPILSEWITIEERPRVLLPMIQRPLRTISGRVVDRQGMPVANIEVFQSGDGPERTATRTDRDGRFTLGGFRQGPVFLFVRGNGFRFFGRLVKPGERRPRRRADAHG